MSETTHAQPSIASGKTTHDSNGLRKLWLRLMATQIGIVPLPVYLALILVIGLLSAKGKVPSDWSMSFGILAVGGYIFMELGKRVKWIAITGAAAIMAFVVPSALTYYQIIPAPVVASVKEFTKVSNFLYVYIALVIVGSIMSMRREVLVAGFLKIFIPLAAGSVLACITGTLTGMMMGYSASHSFFYLVIPMMAGGLGEGAIPLSMGYAMFTAQPQEVIFAQIIPVVMIGSFTAVILSGMLNLLGKKFPHLTGEGQLSKLPADVIDDKNAASNQVEFEPLSLGTALMTIISLYLLGSLCQKLFDFPAPIVMLILVVFMKLLKMIPQSIEMPAKNLYAFTSKVVTFPLLFAMGVALTPWKDFVSAFTVPTVITVFVTVFTMTATGFIVAKWLKMYPIDVAVVNACHSGQGGTGDIAILTAANRMSLMPFAQISTRIGGAITVTLALILIRYV